MNFLKRWLIKQRNKGEIEIKNTAFLFSLILTSIIFLVWIFTVINTSMNRNDSMKSDYETAGPIDTLISNVKSIIKQ